jgi:hypothetical protein
VSEGVSGRYVPNIMFVYAKFGTKSGAPASLEMLPECSDLAGDGWTLLDEQTWRTGRMGKVSDWGVRAREIKSVTALRSFAQDDKFRWLVTQVIPLASQSDAALAVKDAPNRFLRNPRSRVSVKLEHSVGDITAPGGGPSTWAYEQETASSMGPGVCRYLAGTCGSTLYVIIAAGLTESWRWDEIVCVAQDIVNRISRT